MKLLRFGPKGKETPGCLDADGNIRDLSSVTADYAGETVSLAAIAKLQGLNPADFPIVDGNPRIGSIVADTPNFHCVGLNYVNHAKETGSPIPDEPIMFSKVTSALSGPNDDVTQPKGSTKLDWEVELGFVIGRECTHVSEADALDCISGYFLCNDVSERNFQIERGGQWIKGKSAPGFGPCGPWLVTPDEAGDPQNLRCWLSKNGEMQQDSNTGDMIFNIRQIIAYMSSMYTLRTGDLVITGTPEGVAAGNKPPNFLVPGDEVKLGIDGLGEQTQKIVAFTG